MHFNYQSWRPRDIKLDGASSIYSSIIFPWHLQQFILYNFPFLLLVHTFNIYFIFIIKKKKSVLKITSTVKKKIHEVKTKIIISCALKTTQGNYAFYAYLYKKKKKKMKSLWRRVSLGRNICHKQYICIYKN